MELLLICTLLVAGAVLTVMTWVSARATTRHELAGIRSARKQFHKVILEQANVDRQALPDSDLADGLEKAAHLVEITEVRGRD